MGSGGLSALNQSQGSEREISPSTLSSGLNVSEVSGKERKIRRIDEKERKKN